MARVRLSLRVSLSRETTVGDRHRKREREREGAMVVAKSEGDEEERMAAMM